jgi:hypothetical protein
MLVGAKGLHFISADWVHNIWCGRGEVFRLRHIYASILPSKFLVVSAIRSALPCNVSLHCFYTYHGPAWCLPGYLISWCHFAHRHLQRIGTLLLGESIVYSNEIAPICVPYLLCLEVDV